METVLDVALDPMRIARGHFAANIGALRVSQPDLLSPALPPSLAWLFARDGSLTAMLEGDRWWGNCSVPRAAARFMLKTMNIRGTLGCFLSPMHAAQLRVALDLLHPRQALIAILPESHAAAMILHAEDFSGDLDAGRLWLAAGPGWQAQLRAIFDQNPGLPTPIEFVRPILADTGPADRLIEPAQIVFAEASARRTTQVHNLVAQWRPDRATARRVCLIAGSEFRLWDDAGLVLADLEADRPGVEIRRVDPDRATDASPLALAQAAAECGAVLAANAFRSDLPGLTPAEQPWITWVTAPRITASVDAGPKDQLWVADPSLRSLAKRQGWDDARVRLAPWPQVAPAPQSATAGALAILADTVPLTPPKRLEEYSSQGVLWDVIRGELTRDPFLAAADAGQYLQSRRSQLQIGDAGFDAALFMDHLIAPAVQQGLAARLLREGVPVRLFGRGWNEIEGFAEHHRGLVASRFELSQILAGAAAVVHVWPWQAAHPIEYAGRPVVHARNAGEFLREARAAILGSLACPAQAAPPLSGQWVASNLPSYLA